MLKIHYTLPNLANSCVHKSTDVKIYPSIEEDKDFLEKFPEDVVGGPSIVFTSETAAHETINLKLTNFCKSIFEIDTQP